MRRGRDLIGQLRPVLLAGFGGGLVSIAAYGLVLVAQTSGATAAIAALGETSIVIGALNGAFFLGKRLGMRRAIAAAVVATGIVLVSLEPTPTPTRALLGVGKPGVVIDQDDGGLVQGVGRGDDGVQRLAFHALAGDTHLLGLIVERARSPMPCDVSAALEPRDWPTRGPSLIPGRTTGGSTRCCSTASTTHRLDLEGRRPSRSLLRRGVRRRSRPHPPARARTRRDDDGDPYRATHRVEHLRHRGQHRGRPPDPDVGRGRIDHVGLHAASPEAFATIRQRLVDAGASDGTVNDFGSVHSMFFRDPDGLEGEVLVPKT